MDSRASTWLLALVTTGLLLQISYAQRNLQTALSGKDVGERPLYTCSVGLLTHKVAVRSLACDQA